jgi:tRNA pseudouridine55 synthase
MPSSSVHGLLVLDKPSGPTSRDVVDRVQSWFPRGTRMGHTGTLDPLASGVLVLCIGVATRLTEYVQRMEKTYETVFLLGARSTTDDLDGTVEALAGVQPPEHARAMACLQEFLGEIEQVPPAHSAAKVSGRRAYDLARRGEDVLLAPRRVRIHALDLLAYAYPRLELRVRCGKGTYIRSLARDLGERLGCGALVEKLRRTRVGPFEAAHALPLEADVATARSSLLPLSAAVVELPRVTPDQEQLQQLCQGQTVSIADTALLAGLSEGESEVAILDRTNRLVAVAVIDRTKRSLRPEKVLTSSG